MTTWNVFAVGVAVAVAAIVVVIALSLAVVYRRPRSGLEVMQTDVAGFRFDMLLDHQPVLIAEPVASLEDVLRAWFRWNIVGGVTMSPPLLRNAAKYLVVHHVGTTLEKVALEVTNPAHPDSVLRVLMPPRSLMIVPYLWTVQPFPPEAFAVVPVDDVVTWLLRTLRMI